MKLLILRISAKEYKLL